LLNHESEVVLKKIFPVYAGTAPGQLDLPDNFSSGQYQLRAYSRVMLNQPGFTFNKRITIHGKENKDAVYEKIFDSNQLAFFPEGGNFITGVVNVVAFKSIDKNGMPLNITGDVKNSKNEIITSFKS